MRQFPVRHHLRAATASWHDRVDAIFSQFDLADRDDYGRFLQAQAGAHLAVEPALEAGGIERLLPDWPARRRAPQLQADLAALGLAPPAPLEAGSFADAAALLGAVYVLEGARLGGAMLRRSVAPDLPAAFLGGGDSAAWRRLLDAIESAIGDDDQIAIATNSASRVFMLFEQSGRHFLKVA